MVMLTRHLFIVMILVSSCKKEKTPPVEPDNTDYTTPQITLTAPADSTVYHNNDTLFIEGNVTDNDLHEGLIELKDDTTAQVYYTVAPYVHGLHTATINYYWVVNVTHAASASLKLSYTDHHPNTGIKQVKLI